MVIGFLFSLAPVSMNIEQDGVYPVTPVTPRLVVEKKPLDAFSMTRFRDRHRETRKR